MLASNVLFDLKNQRFGVAADASENDEGLLPLSSGDEEARRLGDEQNARQECG